MKNKINKKKQIKETLVVITYPYEFRMTGYYQVLAKKAEKFEGEATGGGCFVKIGSGEEPEMYDQDFHFKSKANAKKFAMSCKRLKAVERIWIDGKTIKE